MTIVNCQGTWLCHMQHADGTITESELVWRSLWQLSWLQLGLPPLPEEGPLASKDPVLKDKQD